MFKLPYRPKVFRGWTRSWYANSVIEDLDDTDDTDDTDGDETGGSTEDEGGSSSEDESGSGSDEGEESDDEGSGTEDEEGGSGDEGEQDDEGGDDDGDNDSGDEDDTTVEVEVNGTTYSFSESYSTDEETAAVAALEAAMDDESGETTDEFEAVATDDEVLTEYLGCYEVSAETGVLTLASPVEVTDPEVCDAIVLHYNTTTGEWEQVDDVQIIDGYVYAVFTSLSPVAVYTVKKKYVAEVTIGDVVTQYETLSDAVAYAIANLDSLPTVTLTWNKTITQTIGPLYSTSTGNLTFDLGGYTIYASVEDGYAISVTGDASATSLVIQNGSIVADETTVGCIDIKDIYATINDVNMSNCYAGGSALAIDGAKVYPTNCEITSENGYCVEMKATDVAELTSVFKECTITQTQTDGGACAAIYMPNVNTNAFLASISDSVVTGDVYGLYNDSNAGKCYLFGNNAIITAPTAVYISSNHANTNGFYTSSSYYSYVNGAIETHDETDTQGIAIKYGYFTVTLDDAWMASGYAAYTNDDEVYITVADIDKVVECTTTDGTVTYKNGLTSAAFTAAGTNGTIKMLKNYTAAGLGPSIDGVVVDMDGHTFTTTGTSGAYLTNTKGLEMTFKNGTIQSTSTTSGACAVSCQIGTINLIDMNIITDTTASTNGVACGNKSKDYAATVNISGNTTINAYTGILAQNATGNTNVSTVNVGEGTVINAVAYAITGNGSYDGTVINVEGGTFTADAAAIYHPQAGTLTINGGEFTGTECGIQICDGDVTINNATVNVTGEDTRTSKTGDGNIPDAAAVSVVNRSGYSTTYPTLKIVDGTFKSTYGKAVEAYAWASDTKSDWDATGYIKISGGKYSEQIDSAYIEDGYVCDTEATDGLYSVSASA